MACWVRRRFAQAGAPFAESADDDGDGAVLAAPTTRSLKPFAPAVTRRASALAPVRATLASPAPAATTPLAPEAAAPIWNAELASRATAALERASEVPPRIAL